jgi:pyridoxamine 5'-phosphate oxidase
MDQCAALHKLMQHLPMHGCDEQAQQAAQGIMLFFDTNAKLHHQDEEENLFPLLRAAQNADADELIKHLHGEHQLIEATWAVLRSQLQAVADGQSITLDRKMVADLSLAYGRHIMLENAQLLPYSAHILGRQQLDDLSRKMAERRDVSLPQA